MIRKRPSAMWFAGIVTFGKMIVSAVVLGTAVPSVTAHQRASCQYLRLIAVSSSWSPHRARPGAKARGRRAWRGGISLLGGGGAAFIAMMWQMHRLAGARGQVPSMLPAEACT